MTPFIPPPESPEQRAKHEEERKHFVFATILIIGCVIMLPVAGAIYVLLIKLGVFAMPHPV